VPTPSPEARPSAAAQAELGKGVFGTICAACHGDRGQGLLAPALIGQLATFGRFSDTAVSYYDYIRSDMPQNAPGSLTQEQYLEVTAYLLVQNNLVQPDAAFAENGLDSIKLPH
jgi:mono/diheme cytochrome c family protein